MYPVDLLKVRDAWMSYLLILLAFSYHLARNSELRLLTFCGTAADLWTALTCVFRHCRPACKF
jgi:hypothetical protein